MKPVVDRLEQEYAGTVEFRVYDVDKSQEGAELMRSYRAQHLPTFVFVNTDGSEAGRLVGEVAESEIKAKLDALR